MIRSIMLTLLCAYGAEALAEDVKDVKGDTPKVSPALHDAILKVLQEEGPKILEEAQTKRMKEEEERRTKEMHNRITTELKDTPDLLEKMGIALGDDRGSGKKISTFASPYCPHCKAIIEDFLTLLKKKPELRISLLFVAHKEDPAGHAAARALMAAAKMKKFEPLFKKMQARISTISEDEWLVLAKEAGLDLKEFEKLMKSKELEEELEQITKISGKMGIMAMPTTIVHGKNKEVEDVHLGRPNDPAALEKSFTK